MINTKNSLMIMQAGLTDKKDFFIRLFEVRVYNVASYASMSAEGASQENEFRKQRENCLSIRLAWLPALVISAMFLLPVAKATDLQLPKGPKYAIDDTKWMTIGMGFRGSGVWVENRPTDTFRSDFSIDNARVYVNGQVHKYVKFEVNTECFFCNNTQAGANPQMSYNILDAIAKVEYNRYLNIWGGRMLVPTERGELSGPFFQATHDAFKTPFFSQDFSTKFGSTGAGRYGRDDGGTFWGSVEPGFVKGTLQYAVGVYRGLQSSSTLGPNQGDDVLWAGRFTYNFLNPEKHPGSENAAGE